MQESHLSSLIQEGLTKSVCRESIVSGPAKLCTLKFYSSEQSRKGCFLAAEDQLKMSASMADVSSHTKGLIVLGDPVNS